MSTHSYADAFARSQAPDVLAALEVVYRTLWPGRLVERIEPLTDRDTQKSGRDVRVKLRATQGRAEEVTCFETLEEKIRRPGLSSQYDDLLVEYVSNSERGTAGWIYTSQADWLVYVRQPAHYLDVRIFDLQALKAWFTPRVTFYEDRCAHTSLANGSSYTTVNKVVPFQDSALRAFLRAHPCLHVQVTLGARGPQAHVVPNVEDDDEGGLAWP